MSPYDAGYRRRGGHSNGGWGTPNADVPFRGGGRGSEADRPWVGGYRPGYQGGSGGIPTGGARRGRGDEWWLGGHHPGGYGGDYYDRAYREFDRQHHPRYSPVGGTYAGMGGSLRYGRTPRPLREDMWFSDWTRWF